MIERKQKDELSKNYYMNYYCLKMMNDINNVTIITQEKKKKEKNIGKRYMKSF